MARPTDTYWRKHQAQLMYEYMDDAEAVSAEIAEIYRQAYNEIERDIKNLYRGFVAEYKVSNKAAEALFEELNGATSIDALIDLLNTKKTEDAMKLKAALQSPSYRRRLDRLKELQAKVSDISDNIYGQDLAKQKAWYGELGHRCYNRSIYDVQREVGFQFSFAHIDDKTIHNIMTDKWTGEAFSQTLWRNVSNVAREVQTQLAVGFITGKAERKIADEIAERYAVGAFESRRLVRTQSCMLSNNIQFEAYEECGAEKYQYVATLDSKTDEKCGALDHKVFRISQKAPGINCPSMHPFCRCTTKIYIDGKTRADMKRRARDPKTGKNVLVPVSTSYTEWAKQNGLQ